MLCAPSVLLTVHVPICVHAMPFEIPVSNKVPPDMTHSMKHNKLKARVANQGSQCSNCSANHHRLDGDRAAVSLPGLHPLPSSYYNVIRTSGATVYYCCMIDVLQTCGGAIPHCAVREHQSESFASQLNTTINCARPKERTGSSLFVEARAVQCVHMHRLRSAASGCS
jgi:hypothetical protein